jgi:hypothetical protein
MRSHESHGEARSKRVAVSFTERQHDALQATASRQRIPVAQLVARIVRGHLATGEDEAPVSSPIAADLARPPEASVGPAWLPPIEPTAPTEWARQRAAAVQALLDRYPGELASLSDSWATDAAVREQLWALTVWRDLLGAYDDPRMELAFAGAMGDFAISLRERPRLNAQRHR